MKCDTSVLSNTTSVVAQSGRITEGNSNHEMCDRHGLCITPNLGLTRIINIKNRILGLVY